MLSSIFNPSQHSGSIQSISNLVEPMFRRFSWYFGCCFVAFITFIIQLASEGSASVLKKKSHLIAVIRQLKILLEETSMIEKVSDRNLRFLSLFQSIIYRLEVNTVLR